MKRTINWRPDTCECEIKYQYDSDLPDTEKVFTGIEAIKCPLHQNKLSPDEHYKMIVKENQTKNLAMDFAKGISFNFDKDRKLTIQSADNDKEKHQSKADKDFGKDKVKII